MPGGCDARKRVRISIQCEDSEAAAASHTSSVQVRFRFDQRRQGARAVSQERYFIFSPFRLDAVNQRLYRGDEPIAVRPKTLAVLHYLLERPGQLVTKDRLLDAVWPETAVTDAVLKVCVRELREALADDPKQPRFIETSHRRGYRFVAKVSGNNLPVHLTSFIGRAREIEDVKRLFDTTRLLTLTGAGGSGKTRLAIEVAHRLREAFDDDVWWVDVAPLADAALVPQTVAASLGVREQPGRTLTETIIDYLRPKKLVLVLDNCEHLVEACASLAEALLRSCAHLRVLATSREALSLGGETAYAVPPLTFPNSDRQTTLLELNEYEAMRLFVERARAAQPRFIPIDENVPALVQVCRRLDGIPLAIELAASRVKALSIEEIAARLHDCFGLLTSGDRTELPRHQTLRATIDWSYDLLVDKERVLLKRLSVFSGGWTLKAAEGVCAGAPIEEAEILDLLSHLIDKSIIPSVERGDETRYRLLETMRQYARQRLAASGEGKALCRAHAEFFLELAEAIEPRINTAERVRWLSRLDVEYDNLRAALRWSAETGHTETELRLCYAVYWFWFHRGYWSEGRGWFCDALERSTGEGRSKARGKAMAYDGMLAWIMGDHPAALARLSESAAIHREAGDPLDLARALRFLMMELNESDPAAARRAAEEGVSIYREHAHHGFDLAMTLASAGIVVLVQGDHPAARAYFEESIALCRKLRDSWALALPLRNLGITAFRQGDYEEAASYLKESLSVIRELREKWFISRSLESLAQVLCAQGCHARAARLFGAGEAMREAVGASIMAAYRDDYDRSVVAARAALGDESFRAASAEGRAMTPDQAIAYALAEPTSSER